MKIRSKLAILMAGAEGGPLNQKQVADATKIRPATISDIYHSRMKRLDVEALERLCGFFECQPGDLFECMFEPGEAHEEGQED